MLCDVCNKDAGSKAYAILHPGKIIKGHEECMQIVSDLIKGVVYDEVVKRIDD